MFYVIILGNVSYDTNFHDTSLLKLLEICFSLTVSFVIWRNCPINTQNHIPHFFYSHFSLLTRPLANDTSSASVPQTDFTTAP